MSAKGERERMVEQIARMRALIDGLEMTLEFDVPCSESAQAGSSARRRVGTPTCAYAWTRRPA